MNLVTRLGCFATCLLVFAACREDGAIPNGELDNQLQAAIAASGNSIAELSLPDDGDLASLPQDRNNPITPAKIALGKLLFHETAIAIAGEDPDLEGTWSCASCHHVDAGFAAGTVQGIGEGGIGFGSNGDGRTRAASVPDAMLDVQPLKSPTVLNSGYHEVHLWNGQFGANGMNQGTESQWTPGTPIATNELGFDGIETQAIAGLKVHRLDVTLDLLDNLGYRTLFDEAFAQVPMEERYNRITMGLAIAAYERTIIANQSPWQQWLRGEEFALTDKQKRGAIVFFEDGNCASCHSGPSLANMSFHALGMADLHDCPEPVFNTQDGQAAHKGRGGFTGRDEDMFAFKTPTLYNLKDSRFYGHGSSFRSVADVIRYKNRGQKENQRVPDSKLDASFGPLGLNDTQIEDLVAFLEDGLYDANLKRYVPETVLSGACFPNADQLSRIDMGCE